MSLTAALKVVQAGGTLSREMTAAAITAVLQPGFAEDDLATLLTVMADRGETASEILGGAEAMRAAMTPFAAMPAFAVDTCGTGGDGLGSFNISTASAIVAAAAGAKVVKHGNRSVSSSCGSADLLEAAGVQLELQPEAAAQVLEECGMVFLYAPTYHAAMRFVAPVRARLKRRTLFNFLGPLCHPGGVKRQLLGIGMPERLDDYAAILAQLGCERGYVVHGADGADELTLAGVNEVRCVGSAPFGNASVPSLNAEALGFPAADASAIEGGDAKLNLQLLHQLLAGEPGAIRNSVLLNAAAALVLAEVETDLVVAASRAAAAIDEGAAATLLSTLVDASQSFGGGKQ